MLFSLFLRCSLSPFRAAKRLPDVSLSKRFAPQNLAVGGLCLPRTLNQGSHEILDFMGTGDIIEGYTMEEIPR